MKNFSSLLSWKTKRDKTNKTKWYLHKVCIFQWVLTVANDFFLAGKIDFHFFSAFSMYVDKYIHKYILLYIHKYDSTHETAWITVLCTIIFDNCS